MRRPLRLLLLAVVVALVIAVLFTVVFPWADRTLFDDPTLGTADQLG